jgi:hypothetical protein
MTIVGDGGGATEVVTLLWHTPDPVQAVSPPPDIEAVFATEDAVLRDTFTGTVITIGVTAPEATVHPVKLAEPTAGHPESFPLLALLIVTAPLVVIPVGNESNILRASAVGPSTTDTVSV